MAYQKNPDIQPGKPNQSNIQAMENKFTAGAQIVYGTGKILTAYGVNSNSNVAFNGYEGVGADKAIKPNENRKAGEPSRADVQEYLRPSSQAKILHIGIGAFLNPDGY